MGQPWSSIIEGDEQMANIQTYLECYLACATLFFWYVENSITYNLVPCYCQSPSTKVLPGSAISPLAMLYVQLWV